MSLRTYIALQLAIVLGCGIWAYTVSNSPLREVVCDDDTIFEPHPDAYARVATCKLGTESVRVVILD